MWATENLAAVWVLAILAQIGIGGLVGWAIAKNKGRGTAGFWLGALLTWIGWIIAAFLRRTPEAKRGAMTHTHIAAMSPPYRPMTSGPAPARASARSLVPPAAHTTGRPQESIASTTAGAARWHPDPSGRFEHRYWDGSRWTNTVSRGGQQMVDPL